MMEQIASFLRNFATNVSADECERLTFDIDRISQITFSEDRSRVAFELRDYSRPPYRGQSSLPIEARMRDQDGVLVSAFVNLDENLRLLEIELIRLEEGNVISPDWQSPTFRRMTIVGQ